MLLQFSVENFLSFNDEQTFSMVASDGDTRHPLHVIEAENGKNLSFLRAAALYGANASGKSNLVKAVAFARNRILNGTRSGQTIPVTPFKLSGGGGNRPSKFAFIFYHQGIVYNYGFLLNRTRIVEEWLYATPNKREVRYFERTTSNENETVVEFGPAFTGDTAKQKQFLEFVAQGTRPSQLFLTEAVEHNVEAVAPVTEWFRDVLLVLSTESENLNIPVQSKESPAFTKFLSDFVRAADTGIHQIVTEAVPVNLDNYLPGISQETRQDIEARLSHLPEDELLVLDNRIEGERQFISRDKHGKTILLVLRTQHLTDTGRLVSFSVEEESEGTQRLIHLATALFDFKQRDSMVLFLDELDRRLHPLMSRTFLETALNCEDKQEKKGQFIFTTHDTNLLDLDLLRRDEIWFVEKDKQGASRMYSLAEFKIRPDLKIQKGYLNGRFGAIPFIGDREALCETEDFPEDGSDHAASEAALAAAA